jgi:hypothetical protein
MASRIRSIAVVVALGSVAVAGAWTQPAAASSVSASSSIGPETVTVPLKAAWKVMSASQLRLSDGPMACRVAGLVRGGGAAATGVRVRCTAPSGSATSFRLSVSVKGKKGARVATTVHFGTSSATKGITTVEQLLAVAPPSFPLSGTIANVGSVSFLVPAGWQRTDLQDATQLSIGDPNVGDTCDVLVLNPVTPNASSVAALNQQLFDITQSLTGGMPLVGEYGSPDVFHVRRQGFTGFGFPFVQMSLDAQNGNARLFPYLVVFSSNVAVPVVPIGLSCDEGGNYQFGQALIFDTLSVEGLDGDPAAYRQPIVGSWGSNNGSVGVGDILAANQHYANASAVSGIVESGGSLYDVTQSWAGDGVYGLIGPFLARFPTSASGRGSSTLVRIYQQFVGDLAPTTRKCELSSGLDGRPPYELCMGKSA